MQRAMKKILGRAVGTVPALLILCTVWIVLNLPAIFYGTQNLPLHNSPISADEQSPINGALHILESKSILGLRNVNTVYYGPLFSVLVVPAVVGDFAEKWLLGEVHSAQDYKNLILWDWGGILWKARVIATLFGFATLYLVYLLFTTRTLNPSENQKVAALAVGLLATQLLFFEYAHYSRHWVYVIFTLVGTLYAMVRVYESGEKKYFVYALLFSIFGFGVSYLSIIFQLVWLPVGIVWLKEKKYYQIARCVVYAVVLAVLMVLVVGWHPHAFLRIIGLTGGDITNSDTSAFSSERPAAGMSFAYYSMVLFNTMWPTLLIAGFLTLYLAVKKHLFKRFWFWLFTLPAVSFFILFGLMGHHESRYVLPITVLATLYAGALVSYYAADRHIQRRLVTIMLGTLVVFSFVYSITLDVLYTNSLMQGSTESRLITELQHIYTREPHANILVVKSYLLGAVHTKEAYQAFAVATHKDTANLYKAFQAAPLPQGVVPLSVTYLNREQFKKLSKKEMNRYDHIVYYYEIAAEQRLEPDYFDTHPFNYAFSVSLQDSYFFLK